MPGVRCPACENKGQDVWVVPGTVKRLNEHSLEDCLGRPRATAIYIVGGWDCLSFNRLAPTLPALFAAEAFSDAVSTGPTDSTVIGSEHKDVSPRMLA